MATNSNTSIASIRDEMAALRNVTYLNWGGSGPSPRRVTEAECQAVHELNDNDGPMAVTSLARAGAMLNRARKSLARFLGCDEGEIALMNSTSDGINRMAWGIDWQPGDEIVISDLEHISGIAPWVHLEQLRGVKLVKAPSTNGMTDAEQLLSVVTPRTRLTLISHVSYISGSTLPVAELAKEADARGFWLGVDGAQSVGAMPVDLHELGVHFYAMPGQKWLLGPDGTGALYVRRDMQERLSPSYVGWASLQLEALHGGQVRFHDDARRYEVAGHRVPSFAALAEAVDVLHEIGINNISQRIGDLTQYLHGLLQDLGGVSIWGKDPSIDRTGLVSIVLHQADPEQVVRALWEEHRIVVRWIGEPRLLRFSVHAFNTTEDLDQAIRALANVLGKVN